MTHHRKVLLAGFLLAAIVASVAAVPGVARSAQDAYQRLETLNRMFEIIDLYYVEDVESDQLFEYAVGGVLENLDPHSRYYTPEQYRELQERYRGDYHGIGIQFDIFDGVLTVLDAIEGGPSEQVGLRPGDQIVGIEGENAIGFDNDQVYERLRGPRGTQVNVTVRRPALDFEEWDVTITRDQVEVSPIPTATMLEGDIGYVWLQTFSEKGADQLERHLADFESRGMRGFVLDLRGNRGGLMNQALRITDKFLSGGRKIVQTKGRSPNANGENYSSDRDTHRRVPMVVLVDHQSASASEIVSGALQDWDRALVAGQLTWGKALVQNQFPFDDGSALFLTIARYYTPSGRLIQRPYNGGDDEDYFRPDWETLEAEVADDPEISEEPETDPAGADEPNASDEEMADRPVYYTAAGREVLGGGGIVPDVHLEPTRVNSFALWLYRLRLTFQFATRYVAGNAAALPTDLETYLEEFEVDDALLAEFRSFLQTPAVAEVLEGAGAPTDEESFRAASDDIRKYLRSHIASNVWGLQAGRVVLLQYDGQVQESLGLIPQAAALLEMQPRDVAAGGAR